MKQLSNRGQKSTRFRKAFNTVIFILFIFSVLGTYNGMAIYIFSRCLYSSLKNYANEIRYPRTNPPFYYNIFGTLHILIWIYIWMLWSGISFEVFFACGFSLCACRRVCICTYIRISNFNIFTTLKLAKFDYVPD